MKNEIYILASINNPFIVKQLGFNQDSSYIHLVLEFVQGGEFFTHIARVGRFSWKVASFYAA